MNCIKTLILSAALMITSVGASYAQTLDEIVAKNIAASGGTDKLKAIKTEYVEGNLEVQGMSMPFKRWVRQGEALRMEFEVMGTTNMQVINGDKGWALMPAMGKTAPEDLDAATVKLTKSQLDVSGELFDWKAKGKTVELIGKDTVNGAPAFKLKVTNPQGVNATLFVDAKTFNIIKMVNSVEMQGQQMEVVSILSDYKKTADGFAYPGVTEVSPVGTKITITKVELNQPADAKLFEKP